MFDPIADIEAKQLVHKTSHSHIDLIPATGHFARYDVSQPEQWESERRHTMLADRLAELGPLYDYIHIA